LQITNKFPNFKSQISRGDINLVRSDKSRYFIKIQDGCKQFCTYCIIPYVRGDLRSRQAEEVIQEVEGAVASGYREIVLCGIHLGLYGADFHSLSFARRGQGEVNYGEKKRQTSPQPSPYKGEGANAEFRNYDLASLLLELINIPQLGRIRLSSIEVNEVTDELIDLIKTSGKICRHLHIPLQSGNDKILKLMNRPYTTKIFASRKNKIKRAVPDIAISTDVIVGFPGESASDFDKTVAFIKKMKFSKVHVFPFSAHERTPAAKMPDQVSVQIRLARSKRLNGLSAKLEREYQTRFKGKKLACIIDGRSKDGRYRAKTEFHFAIEFSS
jgi:threonylcarbamoyladenosine tRNA methylthiotransferase MtaB